ncbi:MAG TPA: preprotein translocase subunit SecY [Candidatus Aenigmarchaeota archaeon]|nr:preprotein translocase subunit SecY [Candidatus Aenigmarchaeota archaeon]
MDFTKITKYIPAIESPTYKIPVNKKLIWTGLVLIVYLMLSSQLFGSVYGVVPGAGQRFQTLQLLLGSSFGTLMTLGIGPIVTASIILQLLVGSKIIDWDLKEHEDRKKYEAVQKIFSIVLCFVEASAFVLGGAVPPKSPDVFTTSIVIIQLALGGLIVILLDEIVTKYGIGSGISLFIAAGVANRIFIRLFTPFTASGEWPTIGNPPAGIFWGFVYGLMNRDTILILTNLLPMLSTTVVFLIVVYASSVSVEIPLAFAALRGFGRRWSLNLFYTSNIPVILTAALLANFQLLGNMLAKPTEENPNLSCSFLGCIERLEGGGTRPVSGLLYYLSAPSNMLLDLITGNFESRLLLRVLTYTLFMVVCAIMFSVFWVNTSGMDAESVAEQITSIGLKIPGYRSNPKIVKQVLDKYIPPLAVIGGALIGLLAAFADFTGALGSGTGMLLTVTILYNFYQQLKMERLEGAHPIVKKIMGVE